MLNKHLRLMLALLAACSMVLAAGCDDDDGGNGDGDTTTDTSIGDTEDDTTETDTTETDTTEDDTTEDDTTETDTTETDTTEGDVEDMADMTGDPECEAYCDTVQTNCTGANSQYTDEAECLTTCAGFARTGMDGDTGGDTLQCRAYHGGDPSSLDPAFHCPHAGPDGGGVCIDDPPSACDRFCANVVENCTGAYQVYADAAACTTACEAFPTDGAFGDASGNTIQCRDRYAQTSVDDPVLCLATAEDGGGLCVDDTDALQLDRMGRPAVNTALITTEHKALYNAADNTDGSFFVAEMATLLEVIDGLDGNAGDGLALAVGAATGGTDANYEATAAILADDALWIDTSVDDCGSYLAVEVATLTGGMPAECGGRTLDADVIDVTLQVLVDLPAALDPSDDAETVVTDAVDANDATFSTDFPYLAAPNN